MQKVTPSKNHTHSSSPCSSIPQTPSSSPCHHPHPPLLHAVATPTASSSAPRASSPASPLVLFYTSA
ncbi:hypothetical protein EJ02DRAFT_12706 [Clathrospora elynae]|uniref:Uncharacterized protein n=1 Tax=Clathrospora elynae TaxID=706981 RepID=A0A6A5T1S5_9PLEO|nr:hypothetical protein EJ02DRAFT_12706 [Clathrospora elynae]